LFDFAERSRAITRLARAYLSIHVPFAKI